MTSLITRYQQLAAPIADAVIGADHGEHHPSTADASGENAARAT